jgi:glycosyltransferase involved in cell wall biosynthesis
MSKILFVDCQVFQSVAWDRGMGKYSLALLQAMTASPDYNFERTVLLFTKNMPLPAEAQRVIEAAAPSAEVKFLDLKVPNDPSLANITSLQKQNQAILDEYIIIEAGSPEVSFLILALFVDQVCIVFPSAGRKILLFYDLIPLQYSERYSLLSSYQNYLARYKTVFEADLFLTISQTVADDVALNLGINQAKIFNINGAPISQEAIKSKKPKLNLPDKYLIMPSGDELRKNNVRAVQGFEAYLRESGEQNMALVITSHFTEHAINVLNSYSKNLIFTGNVPPKELRWLYENAKAMLFVPEYEGLGLPILEAAGFDLPIICSDLTVFNEISLDAFYYSDPFDPATMRGAIKQALAKDGFAAKVKQYPQILAEYRWQNTADLAIKAMHISASRQPIQPKKLRLAVFAPSPSGYSAIGKLVMQLHPAMTEYFDVDYYTEDGKTHQDFKRPNYLPYISKVFPATDFGHKVYGKYDAVLYNIGNSEFQIETIKDALYLSGYAIFHDTHLTDVFEGPLLNYGYISPTRLAAEKLLDKKVKNPKTKYVTSVLNNQLAALAHSDYAIQALVASKIGAADAELVELKLPTSVSRQTRPKRDGTKFTIGLAGIIHPAKGLDLVESIAKMNEFSDCLIHIFGLSLVTDEIISRLRAYPNVQVDTDLTDFQFQGMISQVDVLINYRAEYHGETSLATIEAMRFGVVPIVKKVGWFDELPDDAIIKVKRPEEVAVELKALIDDPAKLKIMKQAARKYIADNHTYQAYAQDLYNLINDHPAKNKPDIMAAAIKKGTSLNALRRLLADSN